MDPGVTIRTAAIEDFVIQEIDLVLVIQRHAVPGIGMASLTEPRDLSVEQLSMVGAMGIMTIQAIFPDGNVIPQERASFLGVTCVALFVDRGLFQQFPRLKTVRIVAI
ncbi:MAG: hypothetical protein A2W03_10060 [Candidatus Aminicenantes bacterium RBG_16_63_16]|nr:MAG: hypothetical protein A2W03_10060 [Candidatus Aminicenantes bacterium RBG_16_63_16]